MNVIVSDLPPARSLDGLFAQRGAAVAPENGHSDGNLTAAGKVLPSSPSFSPCMDASPRDPA